MRGTKVVLGTAMALTLLSGCASRYADTPQPTRFETSKQSKLQAAQHWQVIANNFAAQLTSDLRGKGVTQALHIPASKDDYAFVEGFRELLTTALLAQGWDIRTTPRNALTVDIRYSIYKFQPERLKNVYYHGEATALVAGLWAVSGIVDGGMSAGAKALSVAVLADAAGWIVQDAPGGPEKAQYASGPVPQSEILVTASVTEGDRIVARRSNIYFAADEDKALYWHKPGQGTELRVKGE